MHTCPPCERFHPRDEPLQNEWKTTEVQTGYEVCMDGSMQGCYYSLSSPMELRTLSHKGILYVRAGFNTKYLSG